MPDETDERLRQTLPERLTKELQPVLSMYGDGEVGVLAVVRLLVDSAKGWQLDKRKLKERVVDAERRAKEAEEFLAGLRPALRLIANATLDPTTKQQLEDLISRYPEQQ